METRIMELESELAEAKRKLEESPKVCYDKTSYQEIGGYMIYNRIFVEKIPKSLVGDSEVDIQKIKENIVGLFKGRGELVAQKLLSQNPT